MPRPTAHRTPFGSAPGNAEADLWTLDSGTGVRAEVLTYGGVLHRLTVPDTHGRNRQIVRSLSTMDEYAKDHPYFGALVGRYANRIAHGTFALDGTTHEIPVNDRGHALHGGPEGFHTRIWEASGREDGDAAFVDLRLHSPDGDMGFPGNLDVRATYAVDSSGTFSLDCTATTDRATVVNLTQHAYFNLGDDDILGHTLEVDADHYLPVDPEGIPEGDPVEVRGTPFDLTAPQVLRERLALPHEQLASAGGFDHCWVLRDEAPGADGLRRAARLTAPDASRVMEVWTTEPGIQIYTGNLLDGTFTDGEGRVQDRHGAVCLETQHLPDSPNHAGYPTTVLRPGQTLRTRTEWRFPHLGTGR
ncbi:aldose epimerase family protein [Streptomyces sp. NPDC060184]|uniref:aldose epimerase family protein n=1 Tax=Streptomyces sp. NPDC060184 TaxID=3347064 RepID=UPI003652969C